jgi:hypothetical protein
MEHHQKVDDADPKLGEHLESTGDPVRAAPFALSGAQPWR